MSGKLAGRVAVITGGSNGIGQACALRFAAEGARVVIADLLREAGEHVVSDLRARGAEALFVELDAASVDQNRALAETVLQHFGQIDILVTAAGIFHASYKSGDFDEDKRVIEEMRKAAGTPENLLLNLGMAEWQKVIDVNLTGTFLAIQSCVPHMLENGGSIVTISSIAAKRPDAGPLAYCVSKSGVCMLTKWVARLLGPSKIRVNSIAPGHIATNMMQMAKENPEMITIELPLGRLGTPEEVGNAALFLASDEASYFTGEILQPDGGIFTD